MRCLSCFSQELTHGECYCAINPESGKELEVKYLPTEAKVKKNVLVVGGGVGGMQAAITCAQMGHKVILCEKSPRLGGVLRCEEHVDFKHKLDEYLNLQERTCNENPDIDVRVNTEVTAEMAKKLGADVIIASTGAVPVIPSIKGAETAKCMSAQEAYNKVSELGKKVVILGAGLVGVELGLHLRSLGIDVDIVEMTDHIADGGNFLHISGVRVEIKKRALNIHFNTKATEIKPDGLLCENEGKEVFYPAETVIFAVGQRPTVDAAMALYNCAPEFYMLGDCLGAKSITNATSVAYFTAKNIGRI